MAFFFVRREKFKFVIFKEQFVKKIVIVGSYGLGIELFPKIHSRYSSNARVCLIMLWPSCDEMGDDDTDK